MSIAQGILLGILQGATEFIPVSSSGHLVLVPWLLGWKTPDLVFDTVVHWGTLLALLAFFRNDWRQLISASLRNLRHRDSRDPQSRLFYLLIAGTLPAAAIGFLFEDLFESLFAAPTWVSFFLLVTAGLLVLGERLGKKTRELAGIRLVDALLIGLMQAASIAPGISRSGATTAQGLLLGLERPAAARFSFLLATPIIFGAGIFKLLDLVKAAESLATLPTLAAGFCAALVAGYLCIWGLLRYLQRGKLYPFAVYCALAGVLCLVVGVLT